MKEIQVRSGARFLLEFCGEKKISLACFSASKMLQVLQGMWLPTVGLCG